MSITKKFILQLSKPMGGQKRSNHGETFAWIQQEHRRCYGDIPLCEVARYGVSNDYSREATLEDK